MLVSFHQLYSIPHSANKHLSIQYPSCRGDRHLLACAKLIATVSRRMVVTAAAMFTKATPPEATAAELRPSAKQSSQHFHFIAG